MIISPKILFKNTKVLLTFFMLILSFAHVAQSAENDSGQGFVTDDLFVYMHSGAGNQYRILGTLNAGSQLKLTGVVRNEYSEIIDEKGREAWVETKYITKQPGLRFVVAELNAQLAEATELNNQLDSQLNNAKDSISNLNENSSKLNNEIATLRNTLASTQAKIKTQDTDMQKQWFFTGAIVLGIGLVLGLILPRLGSARRSSSIDNWK